MFKGITTIASCSAPEAAADEFKLAPIPLLCDWRMAEDKRAQCLWQAKPPGHWVGLLRLDEYLVTTDPAIPPPDEVDYEAIYYMLTEHRASMITRFDCIGGIGLIAVAVRKHGDPYTPCTPGYSAPENVPLGEEPQNPLGVESVQEKEYIWPVGLHEPSIIGFNPLYILNLPEQREGWLKKCPEGLWLLNVRNRRLEIYEVLS